MGDEALKKKRNGQFRAAEVPPMGWNSFDCYDLCVVESEVKGNADYMAENLKEFGWEYIVIDAEWYKPAAGNGVQDPKARVDIDAYGRFVPCVEKFPSSAGGNGFRPLADYIHGRGLKFGIHIMRGIPRWAVRAGRPILGTKLSARDIADTGSTCGWCVDMYGVDTAREGSQAWYDSIFALYADWGVDFIKVDDIAAPYSGSEIGRIARAVSRCGREMVLSLSPGPAPVDQAEHVKAHANMWRISGDFWDLWPDLYRQFELCEKWNPHSGPGHWPDADMLPLGRLSLRTGLHGEQNRYTRFTKDEQITLMTLWCIFRSPLMFGGELRDNDEWTLSLLTNREVLEVHKNSSGNRQLFRKTEQVAWVAEGEKGKYYLALFNLGDHEASVETSLSDLGLQGNYAVRDLWRHEEMGCVQDKIGLTIPSHGSRLVMLTPGNI